MTRWFLAVACASLMAVPAGASTFSYVHWTNQSGPAANGTGTVTGTMFGGAVNVVYTGELIFAQINGSGSNYWSPLTTYTTATGANPVSNAPPNSEIIGINGTPGFTNTVTFSAPVTGLIMDIVSLGQTNIPTSYTFDTPFSVLQAGAGTVGGSASSLTSTGNKLTGTEGNGIIGFTGPVTTVSWTSANPENFSAFTFGALSAGVSQAAAVDNPEPATLTLFGVAMLALGAGSLRRRR